MAANATAVWRVRPSGSNTNGGGYDCSIASGATGTNGSFTGTTFTDATAAAFTAGMVGRSINITGVGQYLITAFINASNITLGSGNPVTTYSSGLAWTVGSGQDYSQQNAAQLSNIGTVSTATVTLTDTGASFTAALIGNAIYVSGTGITTGFTYITAVPSGTTLTLQTSPGTTGTSVTYNIGGAWANFWTNANSAGGPTSPLVGFNKIYVLGSGTPNPASYTADYTLSSTLQMFAATSNKYYTMENDPATPGYKVPPDTTGGMPCVKINANTLTLTFQVFKGVWFFAGSSLVAGNVMLSGVSTGPIYEGCVIDQVGIDVSGINACSSLTASEIFSSVSAPGGTRNGVKGAASILNCNIHDCCGYGVDMTLNGGNSLINTIVAKNGASGNGAILMEGTSHVIINCTIDGNASSGIADLSSGNGTGTVIVGNIISNHTTGGTFGLKAPGNLSGYADFNSYYNNTSNYSGVARGPHDTALTSDPYVGQSTENYTLA